MLKLDILAQEFAQNLDRDSIFKMCWEKYCGDAKDYKDEKLEELEKNFADALAIQMDAPDRDYDPFGDLTEEACDLGCRFGLLSYVELQHREKYLRQAVRMLKLVTGADSWARGWRGRQIYGADLSTGSLSAKTAIIFAMCEPVMGQEEKKKIAEDIIRVGIEPCVNGWLDPVKHEHALDSMGHNWWMVIICGAGVAAWALKELDDRCQGYFDLIVEGMREWFRYPGNVLQNKKPSFLSSGDYIEFIGYLTYGLSTYSMMETFYRLETGKGDLFEAEYLRGFPDVYRAFMYFTKDGLRMANFCDSLPFVTEHQHVLYYLAERLERGDMLQWHEQMTYGPNQYEDMLFYMIGKKAKVPRQDPAPTFAVYPDSGYAVVRTGYGKNDRFFAIKTGESWNHNHEDAGTFILGDGGHAVIVDSGCCEYSRAAYQDYYVCPWAHNVILVNQKGVSNENLYAGTKFHGTIPDSFNAEESGFQYLLADCTGPYADSCYRLYRHVVLLKDWTVLIDDIETWQDAEISQLLHIQGTPEMCGNAVMIRDDEAETLLYHMYPSEKSCSVHEGLRDHKGIGKWGAADPDRKKLLAQDPPKGKVLQCKFATKERSAAFYTKDNRAKQIILVGRTGYKPEIEPRLFVGEDYLELILENEQTEKVLFNLHADGRDMHVNTWLITEELYTDASIVYRRESSGHKLECAAMVNGSLLKVSENPVFGSMVKLDALTDAKSNKIIFRTSMDCLVSVWQEDGRKSLHVKKGVQEESCYVVG